MICVCECSALSNMDRVANFYSQPSAQNAYPVYGKRHIKQRGGYTVQQKVHPVTKGIMLGILGAMMGTTLALKRASAKKR